MYKLIFIHTFIQLTFIFHDAVNNLAHRVSVAFTEGVVQIWQREKEMGCIKNGRAIEYWSTSLCYKNKLSENGIKSDICFEKQKNPLCLVFCVIQAEPKQN